MKPLKHILDRFDLSPVAEVVVMLVFTIIVVSVAVSLLVV